MKAWIWSTFTVVPTRENSALSSMQGCVLLKVTYAEQWNDDVSSTFTIIFLLNKFAFRGWFYLKFHCISFWKWLYCTMQKSRNFGYFLHLITQFVLGYWQWNWNYVSSVDLPLKLRGRMCLKWAVPQMSSNNKNQSVFMSAIAPEEEL